MIHLPRSKHDLDAARQIASASPDELTPNIPDLLTWLQDINWPVARLVADGLSRCGDPLVAPVRDVLRSDDAIWKLWILTALLPRCPRQVQEALLPEITRIATDPTDAEGAEDADVQARALLEQLATPASR